MRKLGKTLCSEVLMSVNLRRRLKSVILGLGNYARFTPNHALASPKTTQNQERFRVILPTVLIFKTI